MANTPGYGYLLSLPHGYEMEPQRRWPLILFLHGSAERGADVWALTRIGLPRLLARPADLSPRELAAADEVERDFVVVAPQCSQFEVWDEAPLLSLLEHVTASLRVDRARICFVGLSMGGFGVWSVGMRHPQRFAALVPICGGGRLADVARAAQTSPDALQRLGIWAFHGAQDFVVPLEESVRMIEAARKAGVRDARLTVYPNAGHDAWTETLANGELYAWLLRHGEPIA